MFNVRIKRYMDSVQIQIFKQPVRENFDDRVCSPITGEILGVGAVEYNYFTNDYQLVRNLDNLEDNIRRSVRRTKNKVYDISRSNPWKWFFTFTFNPDKVDSFNYDAVTSKLSVWLNNMRKKCPNMIYIVVPELHLSGRWHFHGLFFGVDNLTMYDSGRKDNSGRTIYNIDNYKFGWSYATVITDMSRCCSYLTKYITKELCEVTKGKKRYWASKNVKLPAVETYYVGMSTESILGCVEDVVYMKSVSNAFSDIVYVESPIGSIDVSRLLENSLVDSG